MEIVNRRIKPSSQKSFIEYGLRKPKKLFQLIMIRVGEREWVIKCLESEFLETTFLHASCYPDNYDPNVFFGFLKSVSCLRYYIQLYYYDIIYNLSTIFECFQKLSSKPQKNLNTFSRFCPRI